MGKSKKGGLLSRQRSALERLEIQYKAFVSAKADKAPWDTTRNGRPIHHAGSTFDKECARLYKEIENVKHNMNKRHGKD